MTHMLGEVGVLSLAVLQSKTFLILHMEPVLKYLKRFLEDRSNINIYLHENLQYCRYLK